MHRDPNDLGSLTLFRITTKGAPCIRVINGATGLAWAEVTDYVIDKGDTTTHVLSACTWVMQASCIFVTHAIAFAKAADQYSFF